jgi:hypothetical protein
MSRTIFVLILSFAVFAAKAATPEEELHGVKYGIK